MANLSISKAWDDSRPIIGRDGRLMFIIALATVVVPQTLLYVMAPEQTQLGMNPGVAIEGEDPSLLQSFLTLVASLLNIVGSIAISYLALTRGTSVADGLRRGLKRLLPTIVAFFLLIIVVAVLAVVVALMFVGVSPAELSDPNAMPEFSAVGAIAVILAIAFFLWIGVRFMLMTPVIAAEDVGPINIFKRSWQLTKGHFWRLLGFLLLFGIGALIFMTAVSLVGGLVIALILGDPEAYSLSALFTGLLGGLAGAALTVVYSVIAARIYLQLADLPADPDVATLRGGADGPA